MHVINMYVCVNLQGPAEVRLAGVWRVGHANASHEMDSSLNISPKMSYGVLSVMVLRYTIACL